MCIRLHLHRIPCDTRPFLTLAKPTPRGRMCLQYVNPYSEPLRCPHRITKASSCRWSGCCVHSVADLPCACADRAAWGVEGPGEDLTRCLHFREYHEYEFRADGSGESAWEGFRYLDEWVTVDRDLNGGFYCESGEWRAAVGEVVRTGERLDGVVRAEGVSEKEVEEAWEAQRAAQGRLRGVDGRRADAFLGWGVEGESDVRPEAKAFI
ncbi:hypothetical protein QBC34DRAFT_477802 [Podospora aff. communis PSN243]|uniref:Uncharacterized protein n=1 Tax=Podospora aff. communis PSN243 TaxID=3040156 RepID=A0AAV9G4Y7_9PEZI|nr:hypothetical protein QBC34DRAFT_477802 [Podospora aff. communis PSN243]